MMRAWIFRLICSVWIVVGCAEAGEPQRMPVILDTDIGTDIDDAYALASLMQRRDLQLLGVTTVSGDAVARARLAAKFLSRGGGKWATVPVYAGTSTATQYMKQADWANGFSAPNLHESGAVAFMRREIEARPGKVTLIAVGELTNVATLLQANPSIAKKIRAISLMGGSVKRGYAPGSKPEPEWNIKSNAKAAQVVFGSGVPLRVAPLDSTADLVVTPQMRADLFSQGSAISDALAALNSIWRHTNTWKAENPTLFDVLAVALVDSDQYTLTPLHIEVSDQGMTTVTEGAPNAEVALQVDAPAFMKAFVATRY
jgi:inosine-uridine nucleoside N-ribohydrolase